MRKFLAGVVFGLCLAAVSASSDVRRTLGWNEVQSLVTSTIDSYPAGKEVSIVLKVKRQYLRDANGKPFEPKAWMYEVSSFNASVER